VGFRTPPDIDVGKLQREMVQPRVSHASEVVKELLRYRKYRNHFTLVLKNGRRGEKT
jgi:hypothetical protein